MSIPISVSVVMTPLRFELARVFWILKELTPLNGNAIFPNGNGTEPAIKTGYTEYTGAVVPVFHSPL